jgi:acetyltransferase-like isoleucine patch superfamily enzyme
VPIDSNHAFAEGIAYARPSGLSRFVAAIAERAVAVDRLGRARTVWHVFDERAAVGEGCLLGLGAWCINDGPRGRVCLGSGSVCRGILRRERFGDGQISIGRNVYIGDDCLLSCCERITIGDFALLAHGVQVFDNNSHPIDPEAREADWQAVLGTSERAEQEIERAPIAIGARAWIGFSSIVLKGVTVGDGAVVAAGSIVTSDVADHTVVAGNPAKLVRKLARPRR